MEKRSLLFEQTAYPERSSVKITIERLLTFLMNHSGKRAKKGTLNIMAFCSKKCRITHRRAHNADIWRGNSISNFKDANMRWQGVQYKSPTTDTRRFFTFTFTTLVLNFSHPETSLIILLLPESKWWKIVRVIYVRYLAKCSGSQQAGH